MAYANTKNLCDFTKLPVHEVAKDSSSNICLIVDTPHKGEVVIEYKKEVSGGLFAGPRIEDKLASEIIARLYNLEKESKEFLLDEWVLQKLINKK